jgi:hypothetical protein
VEGGAEAEHGADAIDADVAALERERRGPPDHVQLPEARQRVLDY